MEQYMLAESTLHLLSLKDYKKGLSISLPLSLKDLNEES